MTGYRLIYQRLIGDPQLAADIGTRVYPDIAPAGAVYPYIVITFVSGTDLNVLNCGGSRVWSDLLWQVEVWSRTNDLAVIAQRTARVDAVLHGAAGVITGAPYASGTVWSCVREQPLMLPPEIDGDVIYRRGGGEYRQFVTLAA